MTALKKQLAEIKVNSPEKQYNPSKTWKDQNLQLQMDNIHQQFQSQPQHNEGRHQTYSNEHQFSPHQFGQPTEAWGESSVKQPYVSGSGQGRQLHSEDMYNDSQMVQGSQQWSPSNNRFSYSKDMSMHHSNQMNNNYQMYNN